MIMWMKSHKVFTSVTCLLLVAALAGTALLLSNHLNTAASADETAFGTYSGIAEGKTVPVTLADGTPAEQYAGTRDPWLWPFSSDSIWNMPIGSGATLTTNPVFKGTDAEKGASDSGNGNTYAVDIERIYLTTTSDPQYFVYRAGATGYPKTTNGTTTYGNATRGMIKEWIENGWKIPGYKYGTNGDGTPKLTDIDLKDSTGYNFAVNKGKAYWPKNLVINDDGNEIAAIVQPDRRTVAQFQSNRVSPTVESGRAVFPYDEEDTTDEEEKFLISNLALVDIYGDGIYGSHWGSSLSAMGGSIRAGELTGDADIHHALKLNINKTLMFYGIVTEEALTACNPSGENGHYVKGDVIPGYVWPASSHDGQNNQTYTGSNPFVSQGSLLALNAKDVTDIQDSDAYKNLSKDMKKLMDKFLYALRDYGCYIVDNSAYDTAWANKNGDYFEGMAWSVSDEEVASVKDRYNVILGGWHRRTSTGNTETTETNQYCAAMDQIILKLRAVTNNTAGSIGGGGTPTKPLAPEIVPLEGITVADQTIPLGSETTLEVVCQPTNASVQKVTYSLVNKEEAEIIEICDGGKKIKGLKSGTATIKVTSDESGFTDTCTVTVAAYSYDVNGDGKVDAKDYAALSKVAGKPEIAEENKKQYDITDDGAVNENDLDALKALLSKGGSAQ